ncbi:MAG: hypothetical protein AABY22_27425 [Nanoarchaeota archaeon]
MEELKLNIFGFALNVDPKGTLVTVYEHNKNNGSDTDAVIVQCESQDGMVQQHPICTMKEYGKTAKEFIEEFKKQNSMQIYKLKNK